MNKNERAKDLTIKIFEIILEEHNGYTPEEIKEGNLGEECECSNDFQRIQELVEKKLNKCHKLRIGKV